MKFLRSNIFIFFILGLFLSKLFTSQTNWDNFYGSAAEEYWRIHIYIILKTFIPFVVAIILNLIIRFLKNEKVRKIFKIIMVITNVLSIIYLLLLAFIYVVVVTAFYHSTVTTIPLYFV